jgi:hypothetical protein
MIQAKFGLNWPSGFRGEDIWKSLQTDDGRQVMAIAHTGELKKTICIFILAPLRQNLIIFKYCGKWCLTPIKQPNPF